MNKIILYLIVLINISACAQDKNKKTENMNEITSQNFVDKVLENVKHYDKEPEYLLRIGNNTMYEVLVNDIPVYKHYRETQLISPIEINYAILKSGSQKVTFRLYSFDDNGFADNNGINLRILTRDKKDVDRVGLGKAPEKLLLEREILVNKKGEKYFEGEITFEAEVPYENIGWSEGQDLTKFDQKELENAVVAFYQKMWNIYNDESKKEEQFPLIVEREREIARSKYYSPKDLEEILKENLLPYTNSTYEMLPLENYKMVFYGDGKSVALEQATLELPLRGYSALGAKYKTEKGSTLGDMSQLVLYLPQGKSLKDGLQIIR